MRGSDAFRIVNAWESEKLDKVRGRMESSSHSSIHYVSELADRREANK